MLGVAPSDARAPVLKSKKNYRYRASIIVGVVPWRPGGYRSSRSSRSSSSSSNSGIGSGSSSSSTIVVVIVIV